ncbi:hypothetical protein [Rodentibacter heidelbergensis]|uniref:Uncharacterized protein n=1 Tax=Rodentibacter heidelbergensis TaxID=1908258 RepID=A0A1V3IC17_9PAST|nr:hypothetical protein [Rodentibacter heidelbergensis]OOF37657.1 hypothetical protein BKK48_01645 [Rodentibacter heidelbergensis]
MHKKFIFLFFIFILTIYGFMFQFNGRQDAFSHQKKFLSSLNERLNYRIKSVENYSQVTAYIVVNLERGNNNFLLYKDFISSMGFGATDNNEYCSVDRERINLFIEPNSIRLVYVYPSSFCD